MAARWFVSKHFNDMDTQEHMVEIISDDQYARYVPADQLGKIEGIVTIEDGLKGSSRRGTGTRPRF